MRMRLRSETVGVRRGVHSPVLAAKGEGLGGVQVIRVRVQVIRVRVRVWVRVIRVRVWVRAVALNRRVGRVRVRVRVPVRVRVQVRVRARAMVRIRLK